MLFCARLVLAVAAAVAVLTAGVQAAAADVGDDGPTPGDAQRRRGPTQRDDDTDRSRLVVHLAARAPGPPPELQARPELQLHRVIPELSVAVYEAPETRAARIARELRAHPAVRTTELDAVARELAVEPNDEHWPHQWGLRRIGAPGAWSATTGSSEVTIAVVDTGVDQAHEDLAGAVATGRNFTGEGGQNVTSDRDGHGTRSAGVALARADNAAGVAGTCWRCTLLPVKVLRTAGEGSVSDVAAGLVWAVDQGADVINLSLGTRADRAVLHQAVTYAARHGVPVVAAAGNFGRAGGVPARQAMYPAAYDEVLGVGASDRADDRRAASSHGGWVELAAPGCNPTTDRGGGYTSYCGTSSAAALVTGTLALGRGVDADASRARLHHAITSTAVEVGYVERGRLDAAGALAALPNIADAPPPDVERTPPEEREDLDTPPGLTVRRIAGDDRVETAAQLSQHAFEPGVPRVYLATAATFPDALAAGALAGIDRGPVLLATRTGLPPATRAELARLEPQEIVVVGGRDAVSSATARAAGQVASAPLHRVAGGDRFETAARLATGRFDAADVAAAYVATGTDFPDALASVPPAVVDDAPVLLAAGDTLPASTRAALAELDPERIEVIGGPSAISAGVTRQLGELAGAVQRTAGRDRFATAAAVARDHFDARAPTVHLATGDDFPDALAGGPVAGLHGGPQLLTPRNALPAVTAERLRALRPDEQLTLGGPAAVSYQVEADAAEASGAERDRSPPASVVSTLWGVLRSLIGR